MTSSTPQISITTHEGFALGIALDFLSDGYDDTNPLQIEAVAGLSSLALRASTGDHTLDSDLHARAQALASGTEAAR